MLMLETTFTPNVPQRALCSVVPTMAARGPCCIQCQGRQTGLPTYIHAALGSGVARSGRSPFPLGLQHSAITAWSSQLPMALMAWSQSTTWRSTRPRPRSAHRAHHVPQAIICTVRSRDLVQERGCAVARGSTLSRARPLLARAAWRAHMPMEARRRAPIAAPGPILLAMEYRHALVALQVPTLQAPAEGRRACV